MHVQAQGATVDLDGEILRIKATTFVGRKALGSQERTLFVDHLRALDFKAPSIWGNGCVTVVSDAGKTLIYFGRKQEPQARALFQQIAARAPSEAMSPEVAQHAREAPFEVGPGEAYTLTHDLDAWRQEYEQMSGLIEEVRTFTGLDAEAAFDTGFTLRSSERIYLIIDGAACIEPRRSQGSYEGGSRGFTVRLARGLSYRVSASRGTFMAGPEAPTIIDTGVAAITNQRVLFSGPRQSREWQFAKLIGVQHNIDECWTGLPVSNRQKTSGIGYDAVTAEQIRFILALAIADFHGSRGGLVKRLEAERDRIRALKPKSTSQPIAQTLSYATEPPQSTPAGWYPDPQDETCRRWWDGTQWTQHTTR